MTEQPGGVDVVEEVQPEQGPAVGPDAVTEDVDEERPVSIPLTAAATFLAVAAAGWMASGVFRGIFPKLVALAGVVIGVGMISLSFFTKRASIVQYLTLPVAIVAGAILVLPDARGGSANLINLIGEAVRFGGVAQPPIPFDPGWRFILLVLCATLGAASMSLATGLNKPKLGIFMPIPLVMGAALLQPDEQFLIAGGVAIVLVIAALAVSYGAELAKEGATSGGFEIRRLAQGGGVLLGVVVILIIAAQTGFLFPEKPKDTVIPPKRPEVQPPQSDRTLFKIRAGDLKGPWRLGVLDGYDRQGWFLTPPYDTKRFKAIKPGDAFPPEAKVAGETIEAQIELGDLEGHVLPQMANMQSIKGLDTTVQWDPRTQTLRLQDKRARRGQKYVITASKPPDGKQLAEAGPAPARIMREFGPNSKIQGGGTFPQPPPEVQALLNEAPQNPWDRLQYVRAKFYEKVTAQGAGNPVAVPASRVVEMLNEKPGTPFEITAAEAMLARWAGIPSRVGYGFYSGERKGDFYEVHPKHGSTYLEVYMGKYGWTPIVGIPPKATSSFSKSEKNPDPAVKPTEELALIVYVPIRLQTIQLLYVVIRYWAARVVPLVLGLLLLWWAFPGFLKYIRRFRRRRWASDVRQRVLASYAEFRDVANDLNVGDTTLTPIEFIGAIDRDPEHEELAWLFTRAIWGDLARDLREDDAADCERMAYSVTRRLKKAQAPITRILAFGTRASMRDPYTDAVPNLWPRWAVPGGLRRGVRRFTSRINPVRIARRAPVAGGMLLMVVVLLGASCSQSIDYSKSAALPLPNRLVPDTVGPEIAFSREPVAEQAFPKAGSVSLLKRGQYRAYSVRRKGRTDGSLQIGAFKFGIDAREREVRQGILKSIGTGRFKLTRIGDERIYVQKLSEQTMYLWFHPNGRYYDLMVAVAGFEEADRVFEAVVAYQKGQSIDQIISPGGLEPTAPREIFDPRRGVEL